MAGLSDHSVSGRRRSNDLRQEEDPPPGSIRTSGGLGFKVEIVEAKSKRTKEQSR